MKKLFLRCAAIVGLSLLAATSIQAASPVTFYHHDALGSIIATSDQDGLMRMNEEYQPYGQKVYGTEDPVSGNEDWYTGKNYSKELDLTYFGARWYDAKQGRFLSIDPAGVSLSSIHSFNRYHYANSNPYAYIDPDGERAIIAIRGFVSKGIGQIKAGFSQFKGARSTPFGPSSPLAKLLQRENLGSGVAKGITNSVPKTLARVVPNTPVTRASGTLGKSGADMVYVTGARDIRGLSAKKIAERLTIPESPKGFRVIEFPTPKSGIASPVNRTDPGFIGGGRTAGGAREFAIPNRSIPSNSITRIVP